MNSSFFLGSVAAAIGFFTIFTKFRFQQDKRDTESSSLSLPSLSTSVSRNFKHHVFPSFHGADVRKTFLSHILESFRRKGIDPFIDNNIERSKSIGPELVEAIKGSKIAIVLLSRKYASSSWCLDELVEIMNCREMLGQTVMTIFYEVDPTNVKKQTGDFGKAFKITCKGKTKEHIERWRNALEDVAKIAGEHSCNWGNEAAMVEKIAIDVSNMLNSSIPSSDFDGFVGMKAHMENMEQLLRLNLDEVRMIGIWGPPGIGKTTIARFLFEQVSNRFQLGAIMVNIKECYPRSCLDEYSAQLQLQNQMLSQMINHKDIMICHLGVAQERLKDKKVLLILDDVDRLGQLNALAKETRWFGSGSRIIVITEDLRVLEAHGITHIYKVKFPSSDEAFQIFCMHAFGQKHPDDGFDVLAWEVMTLAGKLPLGLKVLGSALQRMSKPEWERTLPRLKTCLDGEIGSIMKFSYDALCDEDKYLFLYLACIFINEPTDKVEEILANKFPNVRQGLQILVEKSFIYIEDGRIKIHTMLQQFGRETSHKQFVRHGFVKRQLLVGERDICEVLNDDTIDSRRFIGINLYLSSEEELNISETVLERMHDFQFVRINGEIFAQPWRMQSVLQSLIYHSPKIRSLHWHFFQNICLPSSFNMEFLVELVMRHSKLHRLWEGTKQLRNLKWMDLSFSKDLKKLPDLSTATNLKELNLEGCSSLVKLPSSIGNLTSLHILNLSWCSSLIELPFSIGNATNLHIVGLKNCSNLVELPSIGNAIKLEHLNLDNCSSLVTLPSSVNGTNLQSFYLSNCSRVMALPTIENATNLRLFELENCSSLLEIHPSLGTATNLVILEIKECPSLVKLPSSIRDFTNLRRFNLYNCSSLVELPSILNAINLLDLFIINCSSVVELPAIENTTNLRTLNISGCSSLLELPPSIGTATNMKRLDISGCSSLVKLPSSFGNLTNLKKFNLYNCSSLVELPSIGDFTNLREFDFSNCSSLVELPTSIGTATNIWRLDFSGCSSLVKLPSTIGDLTNLREFILYNCSSLVDLPPSIGTATNLQKLDISGCSSLVKLPFSIGDIISLKVFDISDCSSLVELPSSIENLQQLCTLRMCRCSKIEALPTIINLESLHTLDLTDCSQLKYFPEISTNIMNFMLIGTAIKEVPLSIISWSRLSDFRMTYFESLKEFPHAHDIITELQFNEDIHEVSPWMKGMSCLRVLRLYDCNNLASLPQLSDSLSYIDADNCKSLERLDCSFKNPNIRLYFTNCFKLNQEARDLIMHTSTREHAILPGTQVPACFNYRATAGGSITIKLNERHLSTPLKFKACIMLVMDEEESGEDETSISVYTNIMDKQNGLTVLCEPRRHYTDILVTEHIYTFEVEASEVTTTELVFEFKTNSYKWKIGECGLLQILEVPSS